jgi:alpha-L-fucosidase
MLASLEALMARPLREGTYQAGDHTVYYQDQQTVEDAAHLYAILGEQADTGSPNMENEMALTFLQSIQGGQGLSNDQLAKFLELYAKYRPEIEAFRAGGDDSQDLLSVPDGNTARILD